MEVPPSPLSVADEKNMSQLTQHENWTKKMESVEKWWIHKATEAAAKTAKAAVQAAAKISHLAKSNQASKTMTTSVSTGVTVIDCGMGTAPQTASGRLVLIYGSKGNVLGMSQVPYTPMPVQVMPDTHREEQLIRQSIRTLAPQYWRNQDRSSYSGND